VASIVTTKNWIVLTCHIAGNKKDELGLHYDYESNCLLNDRDGHLWVGTDRGINIMSLHNETFSRYDHRTRFTGTQLQLPYSEVTGTFAAANGDLYIGYWGQGICLAGPSLTFEGILSLQPGWPWPSLMIMALYGACPAS